MSHAIEAQGLGKRYLLQRAQPIETTIVDTLTTLVSRPARWLRGKPDESIEEFWALRDVSFKVEEGEAIGVIGRNGAGKSTLLKIFSRITDPTEGRAVLNGRVASLLEVGTGFHVELSGRENIFLNGAILGMRRREIAARFEQIVEFAGVSRFIDVPIKRYSSGMKMRLAFAVGAFLESEILIVDEVLAVGDMAFQEKCLGTMRDAARGGRTVLFVSHNMVAISSLTQRCLLLDAGRVVFDGATAEAVSSYHGLKVETMWQGRRHVDDIDCDRRWRGEVATRFEEIGLAADQPETIPVGGDLKLQVVLATERPGKGLRIGYSVNTRSGQCLISGMTPLFDVQPGRVLFELHVPGIELSPGEYDLSLSLGIGDWEAQKWEMDCILGFGRLVVTEQFVDGRPFGTWYPEWSPVLHRNCTIIAHHTDGGSTPC